MRFDNVGETSLPAVATARRAWESAEVQVDKSPPCLYRQGIMAVLWKTLKVQKECNS